MAELIEDIVLDASAGVHRPRNLDWKRAAALLYGDWGTSKAYVIGLAFVAAGFSSLPIILAVCALTGLVGINYAVICRHFPDGGGVYSAARSQGRLLAVVGALLLLADLTVTAALSGWSALTYITSGAEHVEWIANLTGVMKLDPGSTMERPSVARESVKAITPVAIEVVLGTALLGWAMLSLPSVLGKTLHLTDRGEIAAVLGQRSEDMLRFI